MTEVAEVAEAVETEDKTTIAAGDNYQTAKSASGAVSKHSGDIVATALVGLTIEETYAIAAEALDTTVDELEAKYGHLNVGMQRMNLGNRIRGVANKIDRNNEKAKAKGEDVGISGPEYVQELAAPYAEAREQREAEAAAAKAKAEQERAEKAAAKAAKKEKAETEVSQAE